MQPPFTRDRIRTIAIELLAKHPEGLRISHLVRGIVVVDQSLNPNTIKTAIWNLDKVGADQVCKPARGLLRLKVFKSPATVESRMDGLRQAWSLAMAAKGPALLANWLKRELQDVEQVMTPARNLFLGLCETPTVLGIAENPRGGEKAPPAGIVSAQMEVDTASVMKAFGQACAARLFARRSYLVVPKRQQIRELMHLHALCELFGLGLVLFDERSTAAPGFCLAVRPFDHDPDPIYEDRCFRQLEDLQSA
jgi:hypothetical protein